MFDLMLTWFQHWLPLIQGFAALASIGGAMLSWRFALKAQRARAEMTKNIVTSKLIAVLEFALKRLDDIREFAVLPDGKPDYSAYRVKGQESKKILESTLAEVKASGSYFRKLPEMWNESIDKLRYAASKPEAHEIEQACKCITFVLAELKLQASTRELSPSES